MWKLEVDFRSKINIIGYFLNTYLYKIIKNKNLSMWSMRDFSPDDWQHAMKPLVVK